MLAIGDSKTVGFFCCLEIEGYRQELAANLTADISRDAQWLNSYALTGIKTAQAAAEIDSFLAPLNDADKLPEWVLINLGSNDLRSVEDGSLLEAAWTADMAHVLDSVHAKWPDAQVRVALPYWINQDTAMASMDGSWIPALIAARSSWAAIGPDERIILTQPGNLDFDTHPTAQGYSAMAAAWQTAMGY